MKRARVGRVSLPLALPLCRAQATDAASADDDTRRKTAEGLAGLVDQARRLLDRDARATVGDLRFWLLDASGDGGPGRRGDAVELTTFHAAKGLEWPVVFVAGVEDMGASGRPAGVFVDNTCRSATTVFVDTPRLEDTARTDRPAWLSSPTT